MTVNFLELEDKKILKFKKKGRWFLKKELGLKISEGDSNRRPVVLVDVVDMIEHGDSDQIDNFIQGIMDLDIFLILLVDSVDSYSYLNDKKVGLIEKGSDSEAQIFAAVDAYIAFKISKGRHDILRKSSVVPITGKSIAKKLELADFDPLKEEGNAFLFEDHQNSYWKIFASVVRMVETYKYPYDWFHLRKRLV